MAQNATTGKKDANGPAFASITASDVIRAPVAHRTVRLHLLPLLKPHKRSGRLCLKVEQLPRGVTLSAGHRDDDGAWVLEPEELENLNCLIPPNAAAPRDLTIRIVNAGNGKQSTLKVLQYPISAADAAPEPEPPTDTFITRSTKAHDPILRNQLGEMHSLFAVRESELLELRAALQRAEQEKAADLEKARAGWELELSQRMAEAMAKVQQDGESERDARQEKQIRQEIAAAEARAEQKCAAERELWKAQTDQCLEAERQKWQVQADKLAVAEIERAREAWQAEQDVRTAALEVAAEQRLTGAREKWQAEVREAASKAETVWKAKEAERFAAAEAAWRERLDRTQAEAKARCGSLQSDVAREQQARADLARSAAATERELAGLRDELAQAHAARTQGEARVRQDCDAAMAKAEAAWKLEEVARRTANERELAGLRDELAHAHAAKTQGEVRVRQDGETAMAKAEAAWKLEEAARHTANEHELAGLRDELAQAHAARTLGEARMRKEHEAAMAKAEAAWKLKEATQRVAKERELAGLRDELAQARAAGTLGEARVRRDGEAALATAEAAWKLEETARHAAAEVRWQARLDTALADAKALGDGEDARPGRELLTVRACLTERDEQLAELRQELEQARRKAENLVAQARTSSAADEAARLAAAEARGQEKSAAALAEAMARCEQAEAALNLARQEILDQSQDDANSERLRRELAAMQALLVNREAELAHARTAQAETRTRQWPDPNLLVGREFDDVEGFGIRRHKPRLLYEAMAMAAVVMALILFWPRLETYFPAEWRHDGDGVSRAAVASAPAVPAPKPAPAAAAGETALVGKGVNMRADASVSGTVVARLARGAEVKVIERRGSWTLVGIEGSDGKAQQGWVFSTYLKSADTKGIEASAPARPAAIKAGPALAPPALEKPATVEPAPVQPAASEPDPAPPAPQEPATAQASPAEPDPAPAPPPAPSPSEAPANP